MGSRYYMHRLYRKKFDQFRSATGYADNCAQDIKPLPPMGYKEELVSGADLPRHFVYNNYAIPA